MIEFHADDYGMFPAAARRIIHCINKGSLNGISLMPNGLYLDECMEILKEECTKEVKLAIHFNIMTDLRGLYARECLLYQSENELADIVRKKVESLADKSRYLVISRNDLKGLFSEHCFHLKEKGGNDYQELCAKANLMLYADPKMYFSFYLKDRKARYTTEPLFYKVIFLDIDGVLNDEGENYNKGVIIDGEMVRCLKHIVDETDAKIILSSSWKRSYNRFVEDGYQSEDKHLQILQKYFDEYGLKEA